MTAPAEGLLAAGLALLLAGAALDLLVPSPWRQVRIVALAPFVVALLASGCGFAVGILSLAGTEKVLSLGALFGIGHTSLRLGHLAGLFLTLGFGVSLPVTAAFVSYTTGSEHLAARGLASGYLLLLAATGGVILAGDCFTFLFSWEALTLAFFVLSASGRRRRGQAASSWRALVFGKLGGASLLLAFLLLAARSGHFTLAAWHTLPGGGFRSAAWVLLVVGFGQKLGVVPFQGWMPAAYSAAPAPARAAMAGVAVNVGIYGLWRFLAILGPAPAWLALAVLLLGGATALLGIAFAGVQSRLSRAIAYSSVENGGIVLVAFGVALVGASVGSVELEALGLLAATLHAIAHSVAKSTLFASAASMVHEAGSDEIASLGGAGRRLPVSGTVFAAGALALAAMPPTVGFVSEWFVFEALMQQFRLGGLALRLGMAAAGAMVALSAGLAAFAFLRLVAFVVLGRADTDADRTGRRSGHGEGWLARGSLVALGASCIGVAALTPLEIRVIARGLSSIVPAPVVRHALLAPWVLQPVYTHFSILSPSWLSVVMPLAVALVALVCVLVSKGRYLAPRRVPAWRSATPGVDGPSTYSAFAFANPLRSVLANLLGTRREIRLLERASAHGEDLPAHVEYRSRVMEPLESWIYRPVARGFLSAGALVRRLQSGRLDAYVGYMAAALVALLLLVAMLR